MKIIFRPILFAIAVIWAILLIIAVFLEYFVGGYVYTDAFGRSLSESPKMIRFFYGQEHLWAGWLWFFGDAIIFLGSITIIIAILKLAVGMGKK